MNDEFGAWVGEIHIRGLSVTSAKSMHLTLDPIVQPDSCRSRSSIYKNVCNSHIIYSPLSKSQEIELDVRYF